jgi:AcrR family transcriptional regulator
MGKKKDFTKRQILDAAFECFSEYGYLKTSLIDVAKRAGISRSLIYTYCKDKKDLFMVMTEEIHDTHVMQSQALLASSLGKKEKLWKIIDIWVIDIHRIIDKTPNPNAWIDALKSVPQSEKRYRELFIKSLTPLFDKDLAEVIVLSIKGILDDRPPVNILEKRINILIDTLVGI